MKKLMIFCAAMVLLLTAASVLADSTITVNGTGEVRISADTAVISLGVNARDQDVLKAQQAANQSIASIRTAMSENGVKDEDITTEFINIYAISTSSKKIIKINLSSLSMNKSL